jgi:hypothetical protein
MTSYKNLVRRAYIEYQQIENYITEKALGIMKLDIALYNLAFTRALQKPSMLSKLRGSDASFRRKMWKRIETDKSVLRDMPEAEKKNIYMELVSLQHESELACLGFDSWESGRFELKIDLLTEQTKVGDLLFMKYKIH